MASFAGVDVSHGAVLAFVRAADDLALGTVFQFAWLFGFHLWCRVACEAAYDYALVSRLSRVGPSMIRLSVSCRLAAVSR